MEFEHLFFSAAAIVLLGLFMTIASVNRTNNDAMEAMIKQGANPIAAHCAVKGITTENRDTCKAALN